MSTFSMCSTFPATRDEVAGHIAQLPFVRALWELFVPLTQGLRVLIIDLETTKDPEKLCRYLGVHKITRLVTAPSLAQTLVSSSHQYGWGLQALKYWFIGGESLHSKVVTAIKAALPNVSVCNLYGATEVHSFATYYPVVDELGESMRVPIGRAISNTSILVLDRHKRILPMGLHGEICVLGDGVANGYLHQPELTSEKFTHHGFTGVWSSALYRTGDIGYYLPDGNLMFVSRRDYQVKIRGIRIELGEVESALLAHAEVDKAVVVSSEFGPSDMRLIAYVVPQCKRLEIREWRRRYVYSLRRFLESKLPPYMIPSYFVLLSKLPLNAYGKVLRKELPAPDIDSVASIGYCPPRNESEQILCEIWKDVLGIDQVGVFDNFFDLGGHSLLATRIKARVNATFSVDLPLHEIFEKPSVSELAPVIDSPTGCEPARLSLTRAAECSLAPLTEESRTYKSALGERSTLAHFCLRLLGEVDVSALRDSLAYLVERHDALRMIFTSIGNGTYMSASSTVHVEFITLDMRADLSSCQASAQKEMLRNTISGLLNRPFDVTSGCLTRWALIQVRSLECVFVGILDHLVVDGPSLVILKRELKLAYDAYCKGNRPNLPPLSLGYFDYAYWQERYRTTASYAAGKEAYKQYLRTIHENVKPIGTCPTPDAKGYFHRSYSIDGKAQFDVADFCARAGITETMFYIVALHLAVYNSFDLDDILIELAASDHKFPELQDVMGLFSYAIRVRSTLAHGMSLSNFVTQTKKNLLIAQSIGLTYLDQHDIDDLGGKPIPHFHIAYRNFPGNGQWELFNLEVRSVDLIERLESAGAQWVGERGCKIVLRVDKEDADETVNIVGSGLIFSKASFEEFNSRLMLISRMLTGASESSMTIDDFMRFQGLASYRFRA